MADTEHGSGLRPLEWVGVSVLVLAATWFIYKLSPKPARKRVTTIPQGVFTNDAKDKKRDFYDIAIVGAGPSGSVCAYYAVKGGAKVLLLDKAKFPRDKHCGDAVCKTAIEIIQDMGVYDELLREEKAHISDSGGLVSPSGYSFIGASAKILGKIPAALACKRIHLDNAVAKAAARVGADLKEENEVEKAEFDPESGLWTVTCKTADGIVSYQARVLVCADGAPSRLATALGYIKEPPQGVCSRAYVKGDKHQFKADGVVFYHQNMLPGYYALFRHPKGELNYCVYLIPGNPKVQNDSLKYWHDFLMKNDPNIVKSLGKNFDPENDIERMKAGPLRLGGIDNSFDRHLIIVGDAAGMIDPMTGEGIHHAMEGGKIAAEHLLACIKAGNYSKEVMGMYQQEWKDRFGDDFAWSMAICQLTFRFPILLDAATKAVARKGDQFLARWADIMTGRVPKVHLLRPEFVIVVGYELILLVIERAFGLEKKPNNKA